MAVPKPPAAGGVVVRPRYKVRAVGAERWNRERGHRGVRLSQRGNVHGLSGPQVGYSDSTAIDGSDLVEVGGEYRELSAISHLHLARAGEGEHLGPSRIHIE